jgi:hypothetical protein
MGFTDRPWVFGGAVRIQTAVGRSFGLLWLVALIGFIGAAVGLLQRQEWWGAVAVASSVISIAAIVPWWNTITPSARLSPLVADVVVLIALLGPWRDQIVRAVG